MKKILLGSLTFLMVFGLSACHDDDASSSTISSSVTPISDSSGNENPSQEDFTIKTRAISECYRKQLYIFNHSRW